MVEAVLDGKVAVVTGAGAGLGRAIALGLAAHGASVAALDRKNDSAISAAEQITAAHGAGRAIGIPADVAAESEVAAAVELAIGRFGHVDLLVNNAGIGMDMIRRDLMARPIAFEEVTVAHWQAIMSVNLTGPFLMTRSILPHFRARRAGAVVNVTTSFFTMLNVGFLPYGPSKAGLEAATAILAKEFAGTGITFNVVVPGGPADTAMVPDESPFDRADLIPPRAMVPPIVWLASPAGAAVTGRRFIAANWDPSLPDDQAAAAAGAPAGWPQLTDNVVWPDGKPA